MSVTRRGGHEQRQQHTVEDLLTHMFQGITTMIDLKGLPIPNVRV